MLVQSADDVLAIRPNFSALESFDIGVFGPISTSDVTKIDVADSSSKASLEVRAFFKNGNHAGEDPVTGSLNASLAKWLLREGHVAAPYLAQQGTVLGRAGQVNIREADGEIWVGGDVVTCISGTVDL